MKRCDEQIDVEAASGRIEAFWWRGKRYRVRGILHRWRETGGWWEAEEAVGMGRAPSMRGRAREILRVDTLPAGVFELALDLRNGGWTLARVWD